MKNSHTQRLVLLSLDDGLFQVSVDKQNINTLEGVISMTCGNELVDYPFPFDDLLILIHRLKTWLTLPEPGHFEWFYDNAVNDSFALTANIKRCGDLIAGLNPGIVINNHLWVIPDADLGEYDFILSTMLSRAIAFSVI